MTVVMMIRRDGRNVKNAMDLKKNFVTFVVVLYANGKEIEVIFSCAMDIAVKAFTPGV
jgi:hypothetical protein